MRNQAAGEVIFVTGSLFVVGEARAAARKMRDRNVVSTRSSVHGSHRDPGHGPLRRLRHPALVLRSHRRPADRHRPRWGRAVCCDRAGFGWRWKGSEKIAPQALHLHTESFELYGHSCGAGRASVNFRFMAKKGLFKIPFLGTHLQRAGHIPVPREDPRASIRALSQAAKIINERHISVLIFPEGGRSENGELQEFKEGAAYIAIKAGIPVVPVALCGTRAILPMHRCMRGAEPCGCASARRLRPRD